MNETEEKEENKDKKIKSENYLYYKKNAKVFAHPDPNKHEKAKKRLQKLKTTHADEIPDRFLEEWENVKLYSPKGSVEKANGLMIAPEEGGYDMRNKLNDLTGKQWIFRTNSIESFESTPSERELNEFFVNLIETKYSTNGEEGYAHEIRKVHPSPKPPQLMKKIIEFFSKKDETVFDPFMGVGGALLGASMINRRAIGIDLSKKYIDAYKVAAEKLNLPVETTIIGNSKKIDEISTLDDCHFDLILTDPPYGDMMAREKTGETRKQKKDDSPTPFTDSEEDIGNLPLKDFLHDLKIIIQKATEQLRDRRYVIVFAKDFQPNDNFDGLLHTEIIRKLNEIEELSYKGFKIWYDKTVNLYPYGYPYAYVGNQLHQYILVFRKEA